LVFVSKKDCSPPWLSPAFFFFFTVDLSAKRMFLWLGYVIPLYSPFFSSSRFTEQSALTFYPCSSVTLISFFEFIRSFFFYLVLLRVIPEAILLGDCVTDRSLSVSRSSCRVPLRRHPFFPPLSLYFPRFDIDKTPTAALR